MSNKNNYTLEYIQNILTYIPKIFIILFGIILIIISYFVLEINKNKTVNLIKQKQIMNYEFKQKENLNLFIENINKKVGNYFLDTNTNLKKTVYKIIGYIEPNHKNLIKNKLTSYLNKIQKENNIEFVVFYKKNLNILYGNNIISELEKKLFNNNDKEKMEKLILMYISSQGKNNLQSWKYDLQQNMIISFFDVLNINNEELYIGAFSKVKNIKQITKNVILNSISNLDKKLNYNIWFHKQSKNFIFNYDNIQKKEPYKNNNYNKHQYSYYKYQYIIGIDYNIDFKSKKYQDKFQKVSIEYQNKFQEIIFYIILLMLFLFLFSFFFSKFIKKIFGKYNRSLENKTKLLQKHKNKVELLVKKEVEKNRKKDALLIQQNKLAAMGGMLENIAHQWRQPLNNVNLILHFIRDNYQTKDFKEKTLEKYINKSKIQIDYMSQTIDDFRNFYKPSNETNKFNIVNIINDIIKISDVQFKNDNINVIIEIEDIYISNYENILKQSLLNILYNAKDAILTKRKDKEFDAKIHIIAIKRSHDIQIIIKNNGYRIKDNILNKIFEPYFTTKFENQGTGIGLYMTKTIIEKNMKGNIKVSNTQYGVKFIITLPFSIQIGEKNEF